MFNFSNSVLNFISRIFSVQHIVRNITICFVCVVVITFVVFNKKCFVSFKLKCQSGARTSDLRMSKQPGLTTAAGLSPFQIATVSLEMVTKAVGK